MLQIPHTGTPNYDVRVQHAWTHSWDVTRRIFIHTYTNQYMRTLTPHTCTYIHNTATCGNNHSYALYMYRHVRRMPNRVNGHRNDRTHSYTHTCLCTHTHTHTHDWSHSMTYHLLAVATQACSAIRHSCLVCPAVLSEGATWPELISAGTTCSKKWQNSNQRTVSGAAHCINTEDMRTIPYNSVQQNVAITLKQLSYVGIVCILILMCAHHTQWIYLVGELFQRSCVLSICGE